MEVFTMESSITMRSQVEESIDGMMEKFMRESGSRTKCMAGVSSHGRMARCMKANFEMIKDMVLEHLDGKMEKFTKVLGKMESSMAREYS